MPVVASLISGFHFLLRLIWVLNQARPIACWLWYECGGMGLYVELLGWLL